MMQRFTKNFFLLMCLSILTACVGVGEDAYPGDVSVIETKAADGVTIYGEKYFEGTDANSPLVLLFHQGGSNGRGEYSWIASWLNENGYRAIAWDQRVGGDTYGFENRTVMGLTDDQQFGFCDAATDLQAALDYVLENNIADDVIVWGSSYSAALIFKLAAENRNSVSGVIAFSPASGGPLAACRARQWVSQIDKPVFVLKPESEMERPTSIEQRDIMLSAGVEFLVIEKGIHGSSMLDDTRTQSDMSAAREAVANWLLSVPTDGGE